ncbi:unnamed protein product [Candidula unifasciata]|uniref:Zinc transporter ZIP14 n=1 Tax=Candidula unifasciata TaxID=100452 RepID=A0A8S3ZZW0_9EUPU|nr:unnamed protein product [Candidula unifasciata]
MLAIERTILLAGIISLATQKGKAQNSQGLQDVFASAVADSGMSLAAITRFLKPAWAATVNISLLNTTCFDPANNFSTLLTCLQNEKKCISVKDLTSLYSVNISGSLSQQDVVHISPALVYSLISCDDLQLTDIISHHGTPKRSLVPKSAESWGYSMLFVTLINLCSLTGAIVIPCMRMRIYKMVLMFMVALAVGTLAGSGLLFLIPEAFLLTEDGDKDYLWKATTIMGGIYLFYMTEKIMRMINERRENTSMKKRRDELATEGAVTTSFRRIPLDNSLPGKDPAQIPDNIGGICLNQGNPHNSLHSSSSSEIATVHPHDKIVDNIDYSLFNSGGGGDLQPLHSPSSLEKPVSHGHSHHQHLHQSMEIAPVAYMVIFGDALHNFIDGLSIGSAFTQSIMTGISVSVAVMCEELPHELGDFAILLNSGMGFRKALMYNFLSACTCYLGTIVGILLGENTESHEWIFAVAGGMFLYISLVDMMPEMNTAAESDEGKAFGQKKTFLLQNLGLLTGYGVMLIFAYFGDGINFE